MSDPDQKKTPALTKQDLIVLERLSILGVATRRQLATVVEAVDCAGAIRGARMSVIRLVAAGYAVSRETPAGDTVLRITPAGARVAAIDNAPEADAVRIGEAILRALSENGRLRVICACKAWMCFGCGRIKSCEDDHCCEAE